MYKDIKIGDVLMLYHQNKPKIQGICVSCFDDYCILRSLQSGFEYKVFYSNSCLKKKGVLDIDFTFLKFLDIKYSLERVNKRVFELLNLQQ